MMSFLSWMRVCVGVCVFSAGLPLSPSHRLSVFQMTALNPFLLLEPTLNLKSREGSPTPTIRESRGERHRSLQTCCGFSLMKPNQVCLKMLDMRTEFVFYIDEQGQCQWSFLKFSEDANISVNNKQTVKYRHKQQKTFTHSQMFFCLFCFTNFIYMSSLHLKIWSDFWPMCSPGLCGLG